MKHYCFDVPCVTYHAETVAFVVLKRVSRVQMTVAAARICYALFVNIESCYIAKFRRSAFGDI